MVQKVAESQAVARELMLAVNDQLVKLAHYASGTSEYSKKLIEDIYAGLRTAEKIHELSQKLLVLEGPEANDDDITKLINQIENRIEVLANERAQSLNSAQANAAKSNHTIEKCPTSTQGSPKTA